jgi:catechol-2,3-dioxygenase
LQAKDLAASAEFYRDILGMQIVGESGPEHPLGATAFLCGRPDEESHKTVLFAKPENAHVAFKVASLADLKSYTPRVLQKGIPIKFVFNHGVSFSFYFDDPRWTHDRGLLAYRDPAIITVSPTPSLSI